MSSDKQSRTEAPTPKKIKEARDEGRIAKSQDLAAWASIFIGVTTIQSAVVKSGRALEKMMGNMSALISDPDVGKSLTYLKESIFDGFLAIAPLMGFMVALAIIGNVTQVRFVLAFKAMKPSFKRLNPISGFKRMFSAHSLWQVAKELVKFVAIGYIAYKNLYWSTLHLVQGGPYPLGELVSSTVGSAVNFIRLAALAGLVIGVLDYFFQRRQINTQLKMTKQEVKEEYKSQDINPETKAKMRSRARQMSRNRMMSAIKDADVLIVNPIHIAIALKYDPKRGAPRVLAKGSGFLAEKIREKADEHKVTIVVHVELARALNKICDIDDEIPGELFEAVAMVLAFVYSLKNRGAAAGTHQMPGTPDLEDVERAEAVAAAAQLIGAGNK